MTTRDPSRFPSGFLCVCVLPPTAAEAEALTSSILLQVLDGKNWMTCGVWYEMVSQGYGAVVLYILIGLDILGSCQYEDAQIVIR
jgi:hypothetical protein